MLSVKRLLSGLEVEVVVFFLLSFSACFWEANERAASVGAEPGVVRSCSSVLKDCLACLNAARSAVISACIPCTIFSSSVTGNSGIQFL